MSAGLRGPHGTGDGTGIAARARGAVDTLRWYVRGVTGADAYERYVDFLRRNDPGAPVPTEKQFWRDKYTDMERNPKTRCC